MPLLCLCCGTSSSALVPVSHEGHLPLPCLRIHSTPLIFSKSEKGATPPRMICYFTWRTIIRDTTHLQIFNSRIDLISFSFFLNIFLLIIKE